MSLGERIYEAALAAARPPIGALSALHPKLRRGVAGRRATVERLERWARDHRDRDRPLVWVHAPSVGEALMAQAIITSLRERRPDAQIAFTFFSPSAERLRERVGADVVDYLPWDTTRDMVRALDALAPAAIAFVRTEVWPVLAREAQARGIGLALVNAALSDDSSRLSGPARWLLKASYGRLDAAGAVAENDARNLRRMGVPADRIHVTGDARFDQVRARVEALDRSAPLLQRLREGMAVMVAGSTWPADERRLLPAYAQVRKSAPLRLIIAPHEVDADHLRSIEQRLDALNIAHARLAEVETDHRPLPDAVIVDRIGILADLYAVARVAYVGGGFHRAGLHSVVEPAALRVPVIFGPRHGNASEAAELVAAGGGFEVLDGEDLVNRLERVGGSAKRAGQAGERAFAWVRSRLGGAAGNASLIAGLFDSR